MTELSDHVKETQERCSGDASYRMWVERDWNGTTRRFMQKVDGYAPHAIPLQDTVLATMRITPYTDSEGAPIYEGDILRLDALADVSEYPTNASIRSRGYVCCDKLGLWSVVCNDYPEMLLLEYGKDDPRLPDCAVIGNVFEHPELLDEGRE